MVDWVVDLGIDGFVCVKYVCLRCDERSCACV